MTVSPEFQHRINLSLRRTMGYVFPDPGGAETEVDGQQERVFRRGWRRDRLFRYLLIEPIYAIGLIVLGMMLCQSTS